MDRRRPYASGQSLAITFEIDLLTLHKLAKHVVHPCKWIVADLHAKNCHLGTFVLDEMIRELCEVLLLKSHITIIRDDSVLCLYDLVERSVPSVFAELEVSFVDDDGDIAECLLKLQCLAGSFVIGPVDNLTVLTAIDIDLASGAFLGSRFAAGGALRERVRSHGEGIVG